MEQRKIRLQEQEVWIIASTPQKKCWMCNYLLELIDEDEDGYFIYEDDIKDESMMEHLRQLIKRDPLLPVFG
jgi:hypothetical protein